MTGKAHQVLVVGGGAAGVLTAATLLREAATSGPDGRVDVTVVERAPEIGPGLAYATNDPHHLLNNYAVRMSAVEDDPLHLVRWCRDRGMAVTQDTFVSRSAYGRYLTDLLDATPVPFGSSLHRVRDEIVDIVDAGNGYLASTASGSVLTADTVVLALGNPPPSTPRWVVADDRRLVVDPWEPGLLDRVGDQDRVLLLGTGLTMVDVAATLSCARPHISLTATSRHGMLPRPHPQQAPMPDMAFDRSVASLPELLAEVRRCLAEGSDWHGVVESVKVVANDVWGASTLEQRESFVRHAARHWEVSRHRMAPAMARTVETLLDSGRLSIVPPREAHPSSYDLVVTCTGPSPVSTPGWNPLVDSLAVKGMLWPGPLGLGVDVDADGALIDADGVGARGMYAVGAARRGVDWEVAAVPDLRRQAVRLARHLAAARVTPPVELVG